MISSIVFYLLSFLLSFFLFNIGKKKNNKLIIFISLSIPIIISGIRYNVGSDFMQYYNHCFNYKNISLSHFYSEISSFEILYFLLVKYSPILFGKIPLFFLNASILIIIFFYMGMKELKTNDNNIIYLLYLVLFFPITFNAVKQGIAMSIAFYSFSLIYNKKIKGIIYLLISCLFHFSAIILLPFWIIIYFSKKDNRILPRVIVTCILEYLVVMYLYRTGHPIFEDYNYYITHLSDNNNYIFYVRLVILMIILLFLKRILYYSKDKRKVYSILSLFIVELALTYFGFISPVFKRMSWNLFFSELLMIKEINNIGFDKKSLIMVNFVIVIVSIIFFIIIFGILNQSHIVPFDFYKL